MKPTHAQQVAGAPLVSAAPTELMVLFHLAQQRYALPLAEVFEIVRLPALVPLASDSPQLCGMLNLRGAYIPVLDGRVLVGEPAKFDLNKQIVIAGMKVPMLGILVDQVDEVAQIAAQQLTQISRPEAAPFLQTIFQFHEESILVLRLAALIAAMPQPLAEPETL